MLKLLKMESLIIFYGDMNFNQFTATVAVEIKKSELDCQTRIKKAIKST